MLTKTKLFVPATLVAAALVALSVSWLPKHPEEDRDDNYVFSVKFEPTPLSVPAKVKVTVDGMPMIVEQPSLSPWTRTMTAEKGAQVTLTASVAYVEWMDCFMSRNGRPIDHDIIHAPGMVACSTEIGGGK